MSWLRDKAVALGTIAAGAIILGLLVWALLLQHRLDLEKLGRAGDQQAFAETIANVRNATAQARAADADNVNRVLTEQQAINQEKSRDYQARLADARARADALRVQLAQATTDPGRGGTAAMPATGAAAGRSDATAAQVGLPLAELTLAERLIATEQAIQLDALQAWVRAQAAIDVGGATSIPPAGDPR